MVQIIKPTLRTGRIVLRPLTASDAAAMYASLSEPEARRLTGTQAEHTLEDVQRHCERIESAADRVDYGIVVGGRLIGEVVLNNIDPANESADFRIAIWQPVDRDKGFGSQACQLMIHHGFESIGLNRIALEVYAFNPRARHVYEKQGFVFEGTRRQALLWNGEWIDATAMAILRSDYDRTSTSVRDLRLNLEFR